MIVLELPVILSIIKNANIILSLKIRCLKIWIRRYLYASRQRPLRRALTGKKHRIFLLLFRKNGKRPALFHVRNRNRYGIVFARPVIIFSIIKIKISAGWILNM